MSKLHIAVIVTGGIMTAIGFKLGELPFYGAFQPVTPLRLIAFIVSCALTACLTWRICKRDVRVSV